MRTFSSQYFDTEHTTINHFCELYTAVLSLLVCWFRQHFFFFLFVPFISRILLESFSPRVRAVVHRFYPHLWMLKTIIKSIKTFPATTFIFNHFIQTISPLKAGEVSEKYTLNGKRESITLSPLCLMVSCSFVLSIFCCSLSSLSVLSFRREKKRRIWKNVEPKQIERIYLILCYNRVASNLAIQLMKRPNVAQREKRAPSPPSRMDC